MANKHHNTPKCALLALPAELRNRIYNYALTSSTPIDTNSWGLATIAYENTYGDTTQICASEPALLRTCSQIRNEGLAIFYGGNLFDDKGFQGVLSWPKFLRSVTPEKCAMLRSVRLHHAPLTIRSGDAPTNWSMPTTHAAVRAMSDAREWIDRQGIPLEKGVLCACVVSRRRQEVLWVREKVDGGGDEA